MLYLSQHIYVIGAMYNMYLVGEYIVIEQFASCSCENNLVLFCY